MTHKHSSPIVVQAFAAPFARYPGYVISESRSRDQHVIVIVLTRPASTDSSLVRKLAHAQHHAAPPKRRQNNVKNVTGRKIGVDRPCFYQRVYYCLSIERVFQIQGFYSFLLYIFQVSYFPNLRQ